MPKWYITLLLEPTNKTGPPPNKPYQSPPPYVNGKVGRELSRSSTLRRGEPWASWETRARTEPTHHLLLNSAAGRLAVRPLNHVGQTPPSCRISPLTRSQSWRMREPISCTKAATTLTAFIAEGSAWKHRLFFGGLVTREPDQAGNHKSQEYFGTTGFTAGNLPESSC